MARNSRAERRSRLARHKTAREEKPNRQFAQEPVAVSQPLKGSRNAAWVVAGCSEFPALLRRLSPRLDEFLPIGPPPDVSDSHRAEYDGEEDCSEYHYYTHGNADVV